MTNARITIGNVELLCLTDGLGKRRATELFPEVPLSELNRHADSMSVDGEVTYQYGSFVLYSHGEIILVDTGMGANLPGTLLKELKKEGIELGSITSVVNTHLHPDHVGWNVTWDGNQPQQTFPRARYWIPAADWEYFGRPSFAEQYVYFATAVLPLQRLGDLILVDTGCDITPEVSLIPTPGHTPGHMSVQIQSAGERGMILGDVVHFPFQTNETHWAMLFDVDKDEASRTREAVLKSLEVDGSLVAAGHFCDPLGYFVQRGPTRYWQPLLP